MLLYINFAAIQNLFLKKTKVGAGKIFIAFIAIMIKITASILKIKNLRLKKKWEPVKLSWIFLGQGPFSSLLSSSEIAKLITTSSSNPNISVILF